MNRNNFFMALSLIIALTLGCSQSVPTAQKESSEAIKSQKEAEFELKKAMAIQTREISALRSALLTIQKNDHLESVKTGLNNTIYEKFAIQDQKLDSLKDSISEELYNKSKESLSEFQNAIQEKIESCNQAISMLESPDTVSEETRKQIRESLQDLDKIRDSYYRHEDNKKEIRKELEEKNQPEKAKELDDASLEDAIMAILKSAIIALCAYYCPAALPYVSAGLCALEGLSSKESGSGSGNNGRTNGSTSGTGYNNGNGKGNGTGPGIGYGSDYGTGYDYGYGTGPRRAYPVGEGEYDCSIETDPEGNFVGMDLKRKSGGDLSTIERIKFEDANGWLISARNNAKTYEIERNGDTIRLTYVNEDGWRRPFTFTKDSNGDWVYQP